MAERSDLECWIWQGAPPERSIASSAKEGVGEQKTRSATRSVRKRRRFGTAVDERGRRQGMGTGGNAFDDACLCVHVYMCPPSTAVAQLLHSSVSPDKTCAHI